MNILNELSGCELVELASAISIIIAKNKSIDEIQLLGNFFSAIGENLSTIGSISPSNETNC